MEVGDGRAFVLLIFCKGHVRSVGFVPVVESPSVFSTIGKGPGNTDGTDGIQPVGILDDLSFHGIWRLGVLSLEGDIPYAGKDLLLGRRVDTVAIQKGNGVLEILMSREELVVVDVMKQTGKEDDEGIGLFLFHYLPGIGNDPFDMVVSMAGRIRIQKGADVILASGDDLFFSGVVHATDYKTAKEQSENLRLGSWKKQLPKTTFSFCFSVPYNQSMNTALDAMMDYVQPTRNFSLAYVLLDTVFVCLFVFLLFFKKKRVTAYWALAGGVLYFLVDFLLFYLASGSREIYSYVLSAPDKTTLLGAGPTAGILFWMSMSYGILDFAFIWLWLSHDEHRIEYSLLIVVWWICCPLMAGFVDNLLPDSMAFMTTRGTGKYHGIMGLIMAVGYIGAIVYNLLQQNKERKVPLVRIFVIGFMAQFLWEAALLVFGIRSQNYGGDSMRQIMTLLQNSLVETNLGMPYIFFIHRFVTSRYKDDGSRCLQPTKEEVKPKVE